MAPPEFPPPFVIERSRSLGFGTGPWSREQLVEAWGAPTADKYVAEAKAAGWLVSPSRGVYHVPNAQDIMLVSWLPEPARAEFLISRTLAAAGIRAWCLSAWCRDQGLDLTDAVFVTDLTDPASAPPAATDRRALQASGASLALQKSSLPFLDNLLIVPTMPALREPQARLTLVPESAEATARRQRETQMGQMTFGIIGLLSLALKTDVSDLATEWEKLNEREAAARGIPYVVDSAIPDDAWIVALLAAIGTSRIEELVIKKLKPTLAGRAQAIQRWASLLGPPQPIVNWKQTLRDGSFPFLLVPPPLWSEMGANQAARRYRMLDQLARD